MLPTTPQRRAGLTLPEIAVVLFLMAAIAIVAVPQFLSGRILSNEENAVKFLRRILAAEQEFLERAEGKSYGFLSELVGEGERRKAWRDAAPLLELPAESWKHGVLTIGGYHFVLFLADKRQRPLARAEERDDEAAPRFFVLYSWPVAYGASGRQVYAATNSGEVWSYQNVNSPYSGLRSVPPAALLAARIPQESYPFVAASRLFKGLTWESVPTP